MRIDFVSLPVNLEKIVLMRLDKEQKRMIKVHLFIFGLVDVLAFAGLVASLFNITRLLATSGFGQYLSLIFSDSGAVVYYWQELVMTLAESLPALGVIVLLSTLGVLVWSLVKTIIKAKNFYYQFRF